MTLRQQRGKDLRCMIGKPPLKLLSIGQGHRECREHRRLFRRNALSQHLAALRRERLSVTTSRESKIEQAVAAFPTDSVAPLTRVALQIDFDAAKAHLAAAFDKLAVREELGIDLRNMATPPRPWRRHRLQRLQW